MRQLSGSRISGKQETQINWPTVFFLVGFHIGSVVALFFWSWPALITAALLYWIASGLGIGMGYHRLMTHRAYVVPKILEYCLIFFGSLALEGGPIQWATTHRVHHAHTDKSGDPHTPRDGRWWSHIGWILARTSQLLDKNQLQRYSADLTSQRFYRLLNRFYYVPLITLGVGLLTFGGWRVMLWGTVLRVTVGLHATWLVNSATHLWGSRRFATSDDSRNNWWVALLTWGEGWHNNHHAHPRAARHGHAWYEIDVSWWGIRFLQLVRLAKAVRLPRLEKATTS